MVRSPFFPRLEDMPATIPVFPLPGVLLLPGARLPLNIFEPRYLAMTQDALATDRLIGMIQPVECCAGDPAAAQIEPSLHRVGCVGRITSFSETDDGRYLITLTGVSRFTVEQELEPRRGYRRVVADWCRFRGDFAEEERIALDRPRFLGALKDYFAMQEIRADWPCIENASDGQLVTTLAMVCPFTPMEKQALLESPTSQSRGEAMIALLEMAVHQDKEGGHAKH